MVTVPNYFSVLEVSVLSHCNGDSRTDNFINWKAYRRSAVLIPWSRSRRHLLRIVMTANDPRNRQCISVVVPRATMVSRSVMALQCPGWAYVYGRERKNGNLYAFNMFTTCLRSSPWLRSATLRKRNTEHHSMIHVFPLGFWFGKTWGYLEYKSPADIRVFHSEVSMHIQAFSSFVALTLASLSFALPNGHNVKRRKQSFTQLKPFLGSWKTILWFRDTFWQWRAAGAYF